MLFSIVHIYVHCDIHFDIHLTILCYLMKKICHSVENTINLVFMRFLHFGHVKTYSKVGRPYTNSAVCMGD